MFEGFVLRKRPQQERGLETTLPPPPPPPPPPIRHSLHPLYTHRNTPAKRKEASKLRPSNIYGNLNRENQRKINAFSKKSQLPTQEIEKRPRAPTLGPRVGRCNARET